VIESLFQTLTDFFAHYGYWVVFFGVMLETAACLFPAKLFFFSRDSLLTKGSFDWNGRLRQLLPERRSATASATRSGAMEGTPFSIATFCASSSWRTGLKTPNRFFSNTDTGRYSRADSSQG